MSSFTEETNEPNTTHIVTSLPPDLFSVCVGSMCRTGAENSPTLASLYKSTKAPSVSQWGADMTNTGFKWSLSISIHTIHVYLIFYLDILYNKYHIYHVLSACLTKGKSIAHDKLGLF